ncbi:MAG: membrane protein insertase YidC [Holosporaceae bacterium]|jgi:YidC/Oxa1 family membrane protein insertase|nr:membrane protein insertase YidC [Holosporaceae bacterium]
MEEDKRNTILFFAISMLIMLGYPYFFENNRAVEQVIVKNTQESTNVTASVSDPIATAIAPVQQAKVENIQIESETLSGVISSRGMKIDNIKLKKYLKDQDSKENVQILSNDGMNYFAQSGWASDDLNIILPNENSCWKADSTLLSKDSPVTLTWDNGNGLLFEKQISIDKDFLITIVDRVKNYGSKEVLLKAVTVVSREFEPSDNSMNFYEGPLGYLNGKLEEVKYEDISKKHEIRYQTCGGWFGITDKYWLTAFIPNQKTNHTVTYKHSMGGSKNIYKVEGVTEAITIAPSAEVSKTHNLFVGAKEINTLDMYEEKLQVQHFDLAIDFGCLYILTKPLLYALAYTKDFVGNMGLGILLITLLIKLMLFPLANKSYRSMNRMSALQPKMLELRKRYEGDNARLGQAISEMYKKEKINPLGGCLPILLQSPVLFALYKVLYISIEMRQAPFILWIHDLSLPDPLSIFNLFGLIPINLPEFLQIGIWPLLMGITMLLQQKMSPAPADPAQANMMLIMPIMFTFMFARLPAGLVLYWTFSNILGIAQQYIIKSLDEKHLEKAKKS